MKRWQSVPQGLLYGYECVSLKGFVCVCVGVGGGAVRSDDISAGVTLVCDIIRDVHASITGAH